MRHLTMELTSNSYFIGKFYLLVSFTVHIVTSMIRLIISDIVIKYKCTKITNKYLSLSLSLFSSVCTDITYLFIESEQNNSLGKFF